MIDIPGMERYEALYTEMAMQPLRITLRLKSGTGLAGYDPLNLDNLLARCVLYDLTRGHNVPNSEEPYRLAIPCRCLWRAPNELPLWAATPFMPDGMSAQDQRYWHKRAQTGEFTRTKSGTFSIAPTKGRYMERRVPLPTIVAERWVATCIGNATEIGRLLDTLYGIGKRRWGEICDWMIEPGAFDLIHGGCLTRPFPALAIHLLDGYMPTGAPPPIGWTPPEWKPSLFAPGWWAGTPCNQFIDYWSAAV